MRDLKMILYMFLAVTAALTLSLVASPAISAEKTIELKLGSTQSVTHTFSKADVAWMDKIHNDTNGRVKITPYWGATLLSRRENTQELIKGVADLGYISPRTGYPLMLGSLGFPYGVGDWKIVWRIYEELRKKFPEIDAEWAKLKIMASSVSSNYQLMSTKPVRRAEDFKGMIIKATGAYAEVAKTLGGDGIYIPMGETYIALQKGTIDGCFAPYSTITAFKFNEVAKYVTVLNLTSSVRPTRAMNLDSWNRLPKDIQEIFEKSIEFWSLEDNKWRDADDVTGIEIAKKSGVEFIELPPNELAKVYKAAETAMLKEAGKLDAKGLPGTKVFKEVRRLVEKYTK
jgi:TRAP-type C4-dicarboxylate transport system substrate-binding protein